MNIIVAGGAGFIGSFLCDKLLTQHKVFCIDNLVTGSQKNISHLLENDNFTFINHDITKPLADLPSVDAVFHLASPASPNHYSRLSYHNLAMETMMANTLGTLELLKFTQKNKARFLFASTSETYGNPKEHPQKETYNGNVSAIGPRSVYDEAKRFGETLSFHFWRKEKTNIRIARIFNTYGPRMLSEDKRMIINFINQSLVNAPITIYGDGKQTRSLCYVHDLVEGLEKLMFQPNTSGEVVNLGSDEEHTVLEYAEMIKKLTNSKSEIIFSEPLPTDDPERRKPDLSKAKTLLSWQPIINLEHGLKKTIDYFSDLKT
ncbi:MAG: NAD-dependent epimerase/dehydratase [Candidatus Roizmanbacteria bacterium GW2011_GWA2_36_23]|uniref:UDP-glucuronate decarboxylase n=1 Tax=Candidatus Roizmanbacteria bacterium GW2011_GWA2_36_23 TaxID=1618480 RepID=A0A0G0E5D6_9BACT|nr:MAG: NAD-dependent epimerase/dehydratase [Candidatus Roizmanbacteria bacterium GW2011_GWA2_36_23]